MSLPVETRGDAGLDPETETLKLKIIDHIERFRCRQNYYGRNAAPLRYYMLPESSIKEMREMFYTENQLRPEDMR